jgi:hypothetical protein
MPCDFSFFYGVVKSVGRWPDLLGVLLALGAALL